MISVFSSKGYVMAAGVHGRSIYPTGPSQKTQMTLPYTIRRRSPRTRQWAATARRRSYIRAWSRRRAARAADPPTRSSRRLQSAGADSPIRNQVRSSVNGRCWPSWAAAVTPTGSDKSIPLRITWMHISSSGRWKFNPISRFSFPAPLHTHIHRSKDTSPSIILFFLCIYSFSVASRVCRNLLYNSWKLFDFFNLNIIFQTWIVVEEAVFWFVFSLLLVPCWWSDFHSSCTPISRPWSLLTEIVCYPIVVWNVSNIWKLI